METIIIAVVIICTIFVVIFGIIYCFWFKKNGQLQKEDFSFDDVYAYREA
jgi:hypothetical protein